MTDVLNVSFDKVDPIKEISDICSKADTCLEGCPFFDPTIDRCIVIHCIPANWDTDAIQKILTTTMKKPIL